MSSQGREAPGDHLRGELAFALQSLEDLDIERGAGDLEEAEYQALKEAYTGRAAAALHAMDSTRATTGRHRPRAWRRLR